MGFNNCRAGPAILQDENLIVSPQCHVDGDSDRTQRNDGHERRDEFRRVVQQHGNAIGLADVEGVQGFGGAHGRGAQFFVSDLALLVQDCDQRIKFGPKNSIEQTVGVHR